MAVQSTHIQYHRMASELRDAQLYRAAAERHLQEARDQIVELEQAFDFHEANQRDLERRLYDSGQAVTDLADVVKALRDYADGPRMSEEERGIDVAKIIMEKEALGLEVTELRRFRKEATAMSLVAMSRSG